MEVCRKATLHVVVITEGITGNAVIPLRLNMNNRNPENENCSTKRKARLRIGNAEAADTNTGEGLLTTNQQLVIMLLQTSLGGA